MKIGNRNLHAQQRASAHYTWSQLVTVALIFLLFIPRCVGCRSPLDPLIEKFYGVELNPDGAPNRDSMTKKLLQEMNSRDSQR